MDPFGRTWERILAMTRQPQNLCAFDRESVNLSDRTII
jgi:hypothetical protein